MGWEYFTCSNDSVMEETFNVLLMQCCINKDKLLQHLNNNNCYRFIINTDGQNNTIMCNNGKYMLRSKFMTNKNFKKCLIDYYKQHNVYVSGPKELTRQDGTSMNIWIIELTLSGKYID